MLVMLGDKGTRDTFQRRCVTHAAYGRPFFAMNVPDADDKGGLMSPWRANKLVVIVAWIVGFIGPILNADAATFTSWSVFAIGVAAMLTLLERLDRLTNARSETPAASAHSAGTGQVYERAV